MHISYWARAYSESIFFIVNWPKNKYKLSSQVSSAQSTSYIVLEFQGKLLWHNKLKALPKVRSDLLS